MNNLVKLVFNYLKANWLYTCVAGYMFFSCILKLATGINITIPCMFKTLFGVRCPGCGLTHAFTDLLQLNLLEAWEHNPLIFIVIPALLFFVLQNFFHFKKKQFNHAQAN